MSYFFKRRYLIQVALHFKEIGKNEIILVIIEPHACKAKHYIKWDLMGDKVEC